MGKKISAGIANVSRRCPKGWVGVNNVARKIKKGWIGDANGKAQPFFSSGVSAGEVVFTASKSWTVPEGVKTIDIFCVGGGGGAGGGTRTVNLNNSFQTYSLYVGGSAGGAYTQTKKNIAVTPGENLIITIGAGGPAGSVKITATGNDGATQTSGSMTVGGTGGGTSVKRGSTTLASANGSSGTNYNQNTQSPNGGSGQTGGGTGGSSTKTVIPSQGSVTYSIYNPSDGGVDGSDGSSKITVQTNTGTSTSIGTPGKGTGKTTKAFEEAGGTVYALGGPPGDHLFTPNTGNGGGFCKLTSEGSYSNVPGASGVVIIRWPEQEDE